MKKSILSSIFSIIILFQCQAAHHESEINPIKNGTYPIHLYISLANMPQYPISINAKGGDMQQQSEYITTTNQESHQTLHHTYNNVWYNAKHYIQDLCKNQLDTLKNSSYSFLNAVREHYILSALALFSATYLGALISLYWYDYAIARTCKWSMWNIDLQVPSSNPVLYKEFKQMLITAIQEEYCTNTAPTEFLTPLRLFLSDVEKEIVLLNRAYVVHLFLKRTMLNRFFKITDEKIAYIKKQLEHAKIVREAFKSWCADYTLHTHKAF